MKRFLKWTGLIFLLMIVLVTVTGVGFVLYARAHVPPWPERLPGVRLEPARPILRAAQVTPDNAFFYLRQLDSTNTAFKLSDDERSQLSAVRATGLKGTNYPALEAWFQRPQPALELCEKAAAMTNCQVETYEDVTNLITGAIPTMTLCKLMSFRAEVSAKDTNWTRASTEQQAILRLSQHLNRGGVLIHHLVSMAGANLADESMLRLALEYDPPPVWTQGTIRRLREFESSEEPFSETVRFERQFSLACLRRSFTEPQYLAQTLALSEIDETGTGQGSMLANRVMLAPLRWLGSDLTRTSAHFDTLFSRVIAIAEQPYLKGRFKSEVESFFDSSDKRWQIVADDPVGRILGRLLLPVLDSVMIKSTVTRAKLRGTQIFLAVCQYRREHDGHLPERLADLVPAYLPELPADPFRPDGGPFSWTVKGDRWCVYSLGPDQDDDGGQYDFETYKTLNDDSKKDLLDVCLASDRFERSRERFAKSTAGKKQY